MRQYLVEVVITHKFVVDGSDDEEDVEVVKKAIRDKVAEYYDIQKGRETNVQFDHHWSPMLVDLADWRIEDE